MQINPYLIFDGNCAEAFTFYEQCFGGKIEMMLSHRDTPVPTHVAEDWQDKIMHASLKVGDAILLGSDRMPDHRESIGGFSVALGIDDPAQAQRVFDGLAAQGKVTMPMQQTFWAFRFGMVTDRFGIPWMINCECALADE